MGNAFLKLSPTNIDTILGIIIPIKEMLPTVTTSRCNNSNNNHS